MKQDGKSDAEFQQYINSQMPSDEILKKFRGARNVGMSLATRWASFRSGILQNNKMDVTVMFGCLTVDDLDRMDHIKYLRFQNEKEDKGEETGIPKELDHFMSTAATFFSKKNHLR